LFIILKPPPNLPQKGRLKKAKLYPFTIYPEPPFGTFLSPLPEEGI